MRRSMLLSLLLVACGDAETTAESANAKVTDSTFIALDDHAPEEVVWDEAKNRLFIIDNVDNRVWLWSDADGLESRPYATLAPPEGEETLPENVTLGQAVLQKDGTLVVTRFGVPGPDAQYGGVVVVHPDGESELVPNLDRSVHRLGVAVAADGTLYGAGFAAGGGMPSGKINKLDLDKGETLVADGFGKLIGLAIIDDRLYASDQSANAIFDAPLADLPAHAAAWHKFAELAKPDQICAGPKGSLFSGQFQAAADSTDPIAVRWIAKDGEVKNLREDPDVSKPSGVSYDAKHQRLFVSDSGNTAHVGVHIFSVP